MRRSLAVVGSAPEFAAGAARVAELEEALEGALCPALRSAVEAHDASRTAELADLLASAGRDGALERTYTAARLGHFTHFWETQVATGPGDGGSVQQLAHQLGGFYDAVCAAAQTEQRWAAGALEKHDHVSCVLSLLQDAAQRTSKPLSTRMSSVLGPPSGSGSGNSSGGGVNGLCVLHDTVAACVRTLARLFAAGPAVRVLPVLDAWLRPWEPWLAAYGDLERRHVTDLLGALDLKDGGGLLAVTRRLAASVAGAQDVLATCAPRCLRLTGGTEVDQLLRAVDDAALSYLTSCQALVRRQRTSLGLPVQDGDGGGSAQGGGTAGGGGVQVSEDTLHAAVEMLPLGRALLSAMAHTEAGLRDALQDAASRLAPALPPGAADEAPESAQAAPAATVPARAAAVLATADAAAVRLALAPPERGRRLRSLMAASTQSRFAALPHAGPRAGALADAVHDLVHDTLLARVRAACDGLAARPHWAGGDPASEAGLPLPVFSASPGEYVTSLGEYLLTLPQLLEALDAPHGSGMQSELDPGWGDANGDAEDGGRSTGVAATWLTRLASAAGDIMTVALTAIPALTPRGTAQLEADVDYFCNVLAALSVAPPAGLATLRALAAVKQSEQLSAAVAQLATSITVDSAVANAFVRMRTAGTQLLPVAEHNE